MTDAVMQRETHASAGTIWFGFFGAVAAWSAQELSSYAITAHFCFPQTEPLTRPAFSGTWVLSLVLTIALLIVALASLVTAVRAWRETRAGVLRGWKDATLASDRGEAWRYLSFAGILLGALFSALIVFNGIALFIVPACGH